MSPIPRLAGLLMAVSLVLAACGSNKATESPAGGGAGASQAAAGSQAAGPSGSAGAGGSAGASAGTNTNLSGDLTVWAMGNEGTMLKPIVDAFNKQYPNVKVSVTPVDWGQAVAKLQTAIG